MPKVKLTAEQVGELIDILYGEIDELRKYMVPADPRGAALVEMKHREGVLLEILEVLEDTV